MARHKAAHRRAGRGRIATSFRPGVAMLPLKKAERTASGLSIWPTPNPRGCPMIYEVRTYTLRTGAVPEFIERYEKRLPLRLKHSPLGAFWQTEFGPLNQVIHVYPYDDLGHRTRVRAALTADPERNAMPGGQDLLAAQEAEIVIPAPFMRPLGSRDFGTGSIYEMRTYTYAPGDLPKVLDAWGKVIES